MKTTITHNGFHGYQTVSFFGTPTHTALAEQNYEVAVSVKVAQRLNRQICGMADCRCGEGLVDVSQALHNHEDQVIIVYNSYDNGKTGEVYGRYVQNR